MTSQDQAIKDVGTAFSSGGQSGLSAEQQAAFDKVRIAFSDTNTQTVQPFTKTEKVISSDDLENVFTEDSAKILSMGQNTQSKTQTQPAEVKTTTDTTVETTGDAMTDRMLAEEAKEKERLDAEAQEKIKEYNNLYTTSLETLSAETQSLINSINNTFAQRIETQQKINARDIDARKAYGLSGGGQYTPISWNDAITEQETKAADKIKSLESERDSLIGQAKSAQQKGEAGLLREKLSAIENIENNMRTIMNDVRAQSDRILALQKDVLKKKEEEETARVAKIMSELTTLSSKFVDGYEDMSAEEKHTYIEKIATSQGVSYSSVYGIFENALIGKQKSATQAKKDALDIQNTEELIKQRQASTAKTWTDIANKKDEEEEATADQEIGKAILHFKKQISTKDWAGVNPDEYQQMYDYLLNTYGYNAVKKLQEAMENEDLSVDYDNK